MQIDQEAFEFKYSGAEGALPITALKMLLEDYASVKGKTQMYADAEATAETLRDFGLDAWESFDDLTADDATEAGMRRLDARGFLKAIDAIRSKPAEGDGEAGDDCRASDATSDGDESAGGGDSDASYVPSGASKHSLQVSELESIAEEADSQVQIGAAAAGNGFSGANNISGFTEVSGGLTTESEDQDLVPGGTDSQDVGSSS